MNFTRLEIPEVILCQPKILSDERGYFSETFRQDKLEEFLGYSVNFCQENESKSSYGVLRGLHYQLTPYAQTKLVRVLQGTVLDVSVDLRKDSPTFGKHIAIELSEENKKQILIPKGFAHGFIVLSNEAILGYKVDNYYHQASERGIAYNDKSLAIDWKLNPKDILVSAKDANQVLFKNADLF
ncbi:dTDP-4-dehydrorhamnose 3,5-epimerase [Flavobacteriaceae bacterium]|nr:dTDP-4-dehydrorhamnose 3,5-epimerase [Flavobacteriaceae bacterium]